MRGACSETESGPCLENSSLSILKCARAIPVVHGTLYFLSALDWAYGPGTCVQWSIGTPW